MRNSFREPYISENKVAGRRVFPYLDSVNVRAGFNKEQKAKM